MASSRRIIEIAEAEVGNHEEPMGSNSGADVRKYQGSTSLGGSGWPWCAAFVEWTWETAGLTDHPANPSTFWFCKNAEARGEFGPPKPGGAIIWCGTHVGLVVAVGDGIVHTIEGNSGDQVARRVRSISGARFINPKGLDQDTEPTEVRYWIEDPGVNVQVYGPWATKKTEAWAKEKFGPDARIVRPGVGGWAVAVGRRFYGPWVNKATRDAKMPGLQKQLGVRYSLRPFRTANGKVVGGDVDDIGKTT